jgi:hypothetical protein
MAINSQSLSTIQNKVTGLTTNETDFRSGVSDTLIQVDTNEVKLSNCDAADLTKLNKVTATAAELNTLDGITASTSELNILNGVTATSQEINLLDGVTATTGEINKLDGLTSTTAELNRLSGSGITTADLQKLSAVSSTATELNKLDGFTGNAADLNRTVQLDAMGNGTSGQVMTSDGDGTYSWSTPGSFTWILEDGDGTEVPISTQEVKFVEGSGIDINWTDISNGNDADPFDLTFTNSDRGSSQNIFKNIQINGINSFSAASNTENLNFKSGTGLSVAGADGDNSVTYSIATNGVGATQLNVSGKGTTSQFLRADGDGSFTWATPTDTNTTYSAGTNLSLASNQFSVVSSPSFTNVTASGTFNGNLSGNVDSTTVTAGTVNTTNINVSGTLVETSDNRLKENVEPITKALDIVNNLNGVYFNKIDSPSKLEVGFIAQEVEAVMPELVEEAGEYKAVSYARTVSVLVEAIKELNKKVEELEAEV